MTKFVYFLQINQIYFRSLIPALVRIKIKCYLTITYVRINFIRYLEITAFQPLKMNIFTVQYIRFYIYKYQFLETIDTIQLLMYSGCEK
jgi:competence CoiA-like predicted nuclease